MITLSSLIRQQQFFPCRLIRKVRLIALFRINAGVLGSKNKSYPLLLF